MGGAGCYAICEAHSPHVRTNTTARNPGSENGSRQLADDPRRSEHAPAIATADISFDFIDAEIPWMKQMI
jgi:hypothetical protein